MKILTLTQILLLHEKIIKETGGSFGVRDSNLLESALNKVFATFDGEELYPNLYSKISVMAYSIISNHAFVDGNKRIGIMVMWMLTKMNNINMDYSQEELIKLGLEVAQSMCKEDCIEKWIRDHEV